MKKYGIYESYAKIAYKDRAEIKKGCSLGDEYWSKLEEFDTLEKAIDGLKEYKTYVKNHGNYFSISEYSIREVEYNEDGEWISTSDDIAVTDMIFEILKKPKYTTVKTFETYDEAEDALADYDYDDDYCIFCDGTEV